VRLTPLVVVVDVRRRESDAGAPWVADRADTHRACMTSRARWTLLLLAAGVGVGLLTPPRRLGDASTYVLMVDSLWADGDLTYEPRDLARARALQVDDLPAGLFLLKGPSGYTYAKPITYPLAALPWYALFGVRGLLAFNGALLATLLLLGADILAPRIGWPAGLGVSALAVGASVIPAYLHWIDPYLFCTTLIAAAAAAWRRGRPAWCAVALVVVASCRAPYIVLVGAPVALCLLTRRWRAAVGVVAAAAVMAGALAVAGRLACGQWSPYLGDRVYYLNEVPFERGAGGGPLGIRSGRDSELALRWPGVGDWAQTNIYFFFGRFGGVLVYYPTLLACALWARRWDREKLVWLAALLAVCVALQLAVPHNMVGGRQAVGNRFFVFLPIAFLWIDFIAWRALRALASGLLLLVAAPVAQAPLYLSLNPGAQMVDFPYRLLPVEWTEAPSIAFPVAFPFPGMNGLDANQYGWESDGVWTIGGRRTEFVWYRPQEEAPLRVSLWSRVPSARIEDGGVPSEIHFTPEAGQVDITLTHPRAVFRDETHHLNAYVVYSLAVATNTGTWGYTVGAADDRRFLGVFVRPIPSDQ
jgi:hypothetical protein